MKTLIFSVLAFAFTTAHASSMIEEAMALDNKIAERSHGIHVLSDKFDEKALSDPEARKQLIKILEGVASNPHLDTVQDVGNMTLISFTIVTLNGKDEFCSLVNNCDIISNKITGGICKPSRTADQILTN